MTNITKNVVLTFKSKNNIMKYKRILLKLSGESLMGEQEYGISPEMLSQYATEIKQANRESVTSNYVRANLRTTITPIKGLDINALTPLEALNKLNEIKKITGI